MQSTYPSSYFEHDNVEVVAAGSSSSSSSSSSPTTIIKQCFSSIQSRKLWGPSCPNTCRLCPSMDLAVLGIQMPPTSSSSSENAATTAAMATHDDVAVASSLWIHRTVSWQRLATLSFEKHEGISRVTWSPDGRHLALASLDRVLLYQVESLSNQTGSFGSSGGETTPNHTLSILSKDVGVEKGHPPPSHHQQHHSRILGLTWAHVGRPHPTAWKLSDDQVEDQISWRYRSRYLDRSSMFLPPSEYHSAPMDAEGGGGGGDTSFLPTCKTPLSLLCISTEQNHELYLHGRYHLVSLPRSSRGGGGGGGGSDTNHTVNVVCSIDLTQLLVHERGSTRLSFYSLPTLYQNRYHLQAVTALHSSITSHLAALQQSIPEVANSWNSSLKPLNDKLAPLQRLLSNYGVEEPEGAVFRQYILIGHTSASSNMANAMDQFFTAVQMNDQLLQRMERSLQGGLANVETMIRKCLVSPARALVYHVGELVGEIRFHTADNDSNDNNNNNNHNESEIIALQKASEMVLLSAETLLTHFIESRFRLRDFVAWLRSTGSQIKARGTANQSVQRDNAKKRRVSEAVMQRVLSYLDPGPSRKSTDTDKQPRSGNLTERLLGMKISDLLRETPQFLSTSATKERPPSPRSVLPNQFILSSTTPSLTYATQEATKAAEVVFAQPRKAMSGFIFPTDFILPRVGPGAPVAIHTRLGRDPSLTNNHIDEDDDDDIDDDSEDKSFFSPKVAATSETETFGLSSFDSRQWSIVAQAGRSDVENTDFLQFFAMPMGWKDPEEDTDSDDDDEEDYGIATPSLDAPFYLTSKLILPPGCTVKELAFYSDDGKSALSSGTDSGTGKESRQKIGFLICRGERLELWLVTYDSLPWQAVPVESLLLEPHCIEAPCCVSAKPLPATTKCGEDSGDDDMDDDDENPSVVAQVRVITVLPSAGGAPADLSNTLLMLSGSRGIGGVSWTTEGVTSLELFDLEEDEEEEEREEEEEEGDEEEENGDEVDED